MAILQVIGILVSIIYHAKIDLGHYMAGDKGGTLTIKRDFPNGWEVGGLVSITDASFQEFGEGSFDKAIFFKIPLNPCFPMKVVQIFMK